MWFFLTLCLALKKCFIVFFLWPVGEGVNVKSPNNFTFGTSRCGALGQLSLILSPTLLLWAWCCLFFRQWIACLLACVVDYRLIAYLIDRCWVFVVLIVQFSILGWIAYTDSDFLADHWTFVTDHCGNRWLIDWFCTLFQSEGTTWCSGYWSRSQELFCVEDYTWLES